MKENSKSHPVLQQQHNFILSSQMCRELQAPSCVVSLGYANEEKGSPQNQEVTGLIPASPTL